MKADSPLAAPFWPFLRVESAGQIGAEMAIRSFVSQRQLSCD